MSIDFGSLPPEITSALIYSGPGATSLTTAASAWNGLAAELNAAAVGYDNVVTQLASDEWLGSSSGQMAAAVQPYVGWLATTGAQAEQTAGQLQAAAAAFEQAFASVVPPPLIAENRAVLSQALATNLLGQNDNLIAELEAQYAGFWAQNTDALYTYAGSSAAASKIEPVTNAPKIVNESGVENQAVSTAAAAATPAASIQSSLQQFFNQITGNLGQLATPAGTQQFVSQIGTSFPLLTEAWFLLSGQTVLPSNIGTFLTGYNNFASFFYNTEGLPYFSVGMGNSGVQIAKSAGWLTSAPAAAASGASKAISGLGHAAAGAGSQVAAGLGNGAHVAGLSVPQTFPGAQLASTVKPVSSIMVSEPITSGGGAGAGNLVGGMPVGGAGAGARGAGLGPRYGFKPTVIARPLSAG
jgi:PPE-repeat protein